MPCCPPSAAHLNAQKYAALEAALELGDHHRGAHIFCMAHSLGGKISVQEMRGARLLEGSVKAASALLCSRVSSEALGKYRATGEWRVASYTVTGRQAVNDMVRERLINVFVNTLPESARPYRGKVATPALRHVRSWLSFPEVKNTPYHKGIRCGAHERAP